MKIETKEIREGKRVGERVWICDYRRPDLNKKPIRNIPPTYCEVVDNDGLPNHKRVCYSKTHFRPISKSGSLLKRIISPVDNTGYRSFCGVELNVFDNEEECKKHFVRQCLDVAERFQDLIDNNPYKWELKDLKKLYRDFN